MLGAQALRTKQVSHTFQFDPKTTVFFADLQAFD
jgi:hypothetical protein